METFDKHFKSFYPLKIQLTKNFAKKDIVWYFLSLKNYLNILHLLYVIFTCTLEYLKSIDEQQHFVAASRWLIWAIPQTAVRLVSRSLRQSTPRSKSSSQYSWGRWWSGRCRTVCYFPCSCCYCKISTNLSYYHHHYMRPPLWLSGRSFSSGNRGSISKRDTPK